MTREPVSRDYVPTGLVPVERGFIPPNAASSEPDRAEAGQRRGPPGVTNPPPHRDEPGGGGGVRRLTFW